jgi:two-component system, NtrC family, sensor histidine kinase PilS
MWYPGRLENSVGSPGKEPLDKVEKGCDRQLQTAGIIPLSPPNNSYDDPSLRRNLQGVLLFRLLLGIFFLVLTLLLRSHRADGLLSAQFKPLYYFSVILFLFTIIAALGLKRVHNLRRFAYLQLFFDVEAVTFLIYLSGGVESLFSFLYMPAIISGAVLLQRRGSMASATASAISYGLLLDLQYFGWIAPLQMVGLSSQGLDIGAYFHSILMNITGFYLAAYLSGYLAEQLLKSGQQIREQKRDFHHLEALHHNITQSINSGLLIISPNGQVLFSNQAAQRILALGAEYIDGAPLKRLFPEMDILSWAARTTGTSGEPGVPQTPARKEVFYKSPGGGELCLGYSVSLLKKDHAATWGWVLVFQDLTRLKSMEDHLQRVERMAYAGKVAAEIAHEIRNPLAAISGAAQMLQSEMARGSFHDKLMNIVSREVQRIDDLITDFLWLAKGAQRSEKIEEVSVCAIIEEVFALLKARDKITDSHRLEREFEFKPVFRIDPQHLRQVLWHLMVNAAEAMPDGGMLRVRVAMPENNAGSQLKALIEITDTGSGIAEEDRDRVFEPFFTTKKSGTGLGLSIVYQVMENLGGRIELKSEPGPETTATLFFPT